MVHPFTHARSLALVAALALGCAHPVGAAEQERPLRVVYFVPADRQPIPGYVERLDRLMREVQDFYRKGMEQRGWGALTFPLERDPNGRLVVHLVNGRLPLGEYGRDASGAVVGEVGEALRKEGRDPDREVLVVFQVLLDWRNGQAVEVGPYCGGGSVAGGFALVYDDERLDPRLLGSKEPGAYYGGPCSVGAFNSHYIGGVAHELGHGFSLPHDCETQADQVRGHSLMGYGNHTYGEEQRGEGRGTFLSSVSAMVLAKHPLFTGAGQAVGTAPSCRLEALEPAFADGKLVLRGRVVAQPAAYGIAGYNDDLQKAADYDAVGWTSAVAPSGEFRLEIGDLKPGRYELRLRACHADGTGTVFPFSYGVDPNGVPDLRALGESALIAEAMSDLSRGDLDSLRRVVTRMQSAFTDDAEFQRKAAHLLTLSSPPRPRSPASIPPAEKSVPVSSLEFREAVVGWGRPLRDQVLPENQSCFLQVDGRFFERGLYAHAPSTYEVQAGRQWSTLRAGYGLQDGNDGSVAFVVRGDGRELFRSEVVKDHRLREVKLDISGVDGLQFVTEDGSDGRTSDWGVWLEPTLERY